MHKQVSTQVLAVLAVVLLLSSPHLATGEDAVLKLDLKLDGEIRSLRFTPRDDLVQAAERFEHEQLRGVQGARRRPHRRRRRAKLLVIGSSRMHIRCARSFVTLEHGAGAAPP